MKMHLNLSPQWSKLIAVCLIFQAIKCLEFRSFPTQTNYANCKTFSTSAISIIYCDQKYYWLSNLDPLNTIYDSGSLELINSTSASTAANQIQYSYSRFLTKTLQVDTMGNPTFALDPLFQANDIVNRTTAPASVIIEDFLFINNEYGVIKLNNNSFIPFLILSPTTNKYFARKDVATLRSWSFDQNNQYLTFGNGTDIIRSTLNVTRDAKGTTITNIAFIDQVLYRRLNHTSFFFQGTYLVVSCSTCDSNIGRIQIYNYLQPLGPNATNTTTTTTLNNMTLYLEINKTSNSTYFNIGEKTYFEVINKFLSRLIFTARPNIITTTPRNLYQIDILQNNSRLLFRNQTIYSQMQNYTFNTLSYSRGFLLDLENQTYTVNTTNPTTNVTTSRQQWQTNARFTQQCLLNQYYDNYKCNQCGDNQGVYDFQMRYCQSCYDMVKENDTFASAMAFQFCTNPFDQSDNNKPNDTDPVPVDPEPVKNDTIPEPPPVVKDKGSSSEINIGLIVGIVVGVIVIIIVIVVVIICCRRCKKQQEDDEEKAPPQKGNNKAKSKQQEKKASSSRKDAYIDKNPTTDQELNKNNKGVGEDDSDYSRPNQNKMTNPEFQASPDNIEIKLDEERMKTGIKGSDEENRPLSAKNQKPQADGPPAAQRPFAQLSSNAKSQPQNAKESARNRLQIRGDAQYSGVEPQANETSFSSDYDDRTLQSPESFAGMGNQQNGAKYSYSSNSNISRVPEGGQRKISNNVQLKKDKEDSVQDEQSDEDIRVAKPSERNLVNDKFGDIKKSTGKFGSQVNGVGIRNGSQVTGANIVQNNQPAGIRSNVPANNNVGRQDVKSNADKKNQVQRQDSSVRGSENSISDDDE